MLRFLVCWLLMAVLARSSDAQWVNVPTEEQLAQTPGLIHETYESRVMKSTVGYSVVLPPSYQQGKRTYPVVYWLHGGGGHESSSLYTALPWSQLLQAGQVGELILVYPSAHRSGYMDHFDHKVMAESMIIRELIPRIDKRFRTVASREGRAVHGFSMGASGALKFAIKYPELFCAAVAYGGGSIDLEQDKTKFILDILEANLKSDPDLIRQNNTYHFLEQNHRRVRESKLALLLICGGDDYWKASAVTFQAALAEHQIPCELRLVPGVGHDLRRLIEAEGRTAAIFQDNVFKRQPTR